MSPKSLVFLKYYYYQVKHKEDIISKYESGQIRAKRQKLSVGKHDFVDKTVYSSIVNEVVRTISNQFFFLLFLRKDFARIKTETKPKPTNKTKNNKSKNLLRLKTSKRERKLVGFGLV